MRSRILDELIVSGAAVAHDARVTDAARALCEAGVGAVAVLEGGHVVGTFTADDMLRASFPPYLDELRHTAFVDDDAVLRPHLARAASDPVATYMREAELVELPASALDLAQRFLHSDATTLVAVRAGMYAGVIDQWLFCKAILGRYGWDI